MSYDIIEDLAKRSKRRRRNIYNPTPTSIDHMKFVRHGHWREYERHKSLTVAYALKAWLEGTTFPARIRPILTRKGRMYSVQIYTRYKIGKKI